MATDEIMGATAAMRPNQNTRQGALNPVGSFRMGSVATQTDNKPFHADMPLGDEPLLGFSASVPSSPLMNAFGDGLTACGHTADDVCHGCY